MVADRDELQLRRIEEIQCELRRALVEDSLERLDELLAEKKSRLDTLLAGPLLGENASEGERQRFQELLRRDLALEALMKQKLKVLGNRLRKTRAARNGVGQYAFATAHLSSQLLARTDVTG